MGDLTGACAPRANVIVAKVGDEAVLLNTETGVYFALNPVGARIWELLSPDRSPDAIHGLLLQEFDVAPDTLARDMADFLDALHQRQLVIPVATPSS